MAAAAVTDAELRAYIRRNLIYSVIGLVVLFAVLAGLGAWYEEELHHFAQVMFDSLGLGGLAALVFVADAITSPIPPDVALIVIASSELAENWLWPVFLLGVVSTAAGCVGWWIGGHLGKLKQVRIIRRRLLRPEQQALVTRYGRVGVMLGALTPIPFSITCWLAGMVGMKFRDFAPAVMLRVPRVLGYYFIIAHSVRLFAE